jgi:signal-transduction protein with cAMP-binding, CBS, and nucleotidyltransferase domain
MALGHRVELQDDLGPGEAGEEPQHLCGLGCPVTHLMSAPPLFGDPELTLRDVAETMSAEGVGALVLIRPDGPSSIITERDVVNALALSANPDSVWAADVSSIDLVAVDASDTIAEAVRLMAAEGIRHLPVRQSGEVIGMVSSRDVIEVLASLLADAF